MTVVMLTMIFALYFMSLLDTSYEKQILISLYIVLAHGSESIYLVCGLAKKFILVKFSQLCTGRVNRQSFAISRNFPEFPFHKKSCLDL